MKAEFAKTNAEVIAALKKYEKWLKTDLLARSNGDFRIGAETFAKKLQYEDMVNTPLDRLLESGMRICGRIRRQFEEGGKRD